MIEGVILDIDGTLLLSNEAHAHAWVDAFADFGYQASFFQLKWLIGMGGDKLMATISPTMSPEEGIGKVISHRRSNLFLQRYAPFLEPASGSRALVERMRRAGLQLVVATSAKEHELETLLEKAQVKDLLDVTTTSSEVEQSKPAPDVVQVAMEKLGLQPDRAIMIGDTPYDIESARKAGVEVIAVRCGGWDDDSLGEAVAIYDNPADLLAHYDESPLGRTAGGTA